jgi:hypothetical protein
VADDDCSGVVYFAGSHLAVDSPVPEEARMNDYVTFRRMITPVFIQVIFWVIVAAIVIAGIAIIADGRAGPGLLTIVVGPLVARIYAEILIVIFRIHDNVAAIRVQGAPATPVGTATAAPEQAYPTT